MALDRLGIPLGKNGIAFATYANAVSSTLLCWENEIIQLKFSPADLVTLQFLLLEAKIEGVTDPRPDIPRLETALAPYGERIWTLHPLVELGENA